MIKEIIYALSNENLKSMLFAFMIVVLSKEYMMPKSFLVGILLYIIASAMILRPIVKMYDVDKSNNLNKGVGQRPFTFLY